MIHTLEIYLQNVNKEQYEKIIAQCKWIIQDKQFKNTQYRNKGITICCWKKVKRNVYQTDTHFMIYAKLNPLKLAGNSSKVAVYSSQYKDTAISEFNSVMEKLGLPGIDFWKIRRCDFCINIKTEYPAAYTELMKRSDKQWYQEEQTFDNNASRYLTGKGATINFYDKGKQLQLLGHDVSKEDMELAKNTLRMEVQCHKTTLDTMLPKYGLPDRYLSTWLASDQLEEMCQSVILESVRYTCKDGRYYRADIAKNMINSSNFTRKAKEKCIFIIEKLSKMPIYRYKETLGKKGNLTERQFAYNMKKLQGLNINPITIPARLSAKIHQQELESLVILTTQALQEESIG